jgi:hypothetical protein
MLCGIGSLLAIGGVRHHRIPLRREVGEKESFLSGSKVVAAEMAGKDNMSPGSNEQMFGKKQQVPDGGQSD